MDAEVDAREADAEDGQRRQRVHDRLRGDRSVLYEMMRNDRIRRRGKQRMSARKTMRVRQRNAPRALDRTLALEDVFQQRVDGHRAAGGNDDGPGILAPSLPPHRQRGDARGAADGDVRAELRDAVHGRMHRWIVDAVNHVHDDVVVTVRAPRHDLFRLLFEEPERDASESHAAARPDGQRQKPMPPFRRFLRLFSHGGESTLRRNFVRSTLDCASQA